MNSRLSVFLAGAALCGGLNCLAFAQPTTTVVQQPLPERDQMRQVRVKNVPPSLIAWWIDPAHQPEPLHFQRARINREKFSSIAAHAKEDVAVLPAGVKRIVAIDPQNALLVYGTEAGTREIEKLVSVFDKPLRQVEIEAQFVQMNLQELSALGIQDTEPGQTQQEFQIRFVRGNFAEELQKLVKQNKAKVWTAPRVIAINNLTASLGSITPFPNTLGTQNGADQITNPAEDTNGPRIGFSVTMTPTINNDETVTVHMSMATAFDTKGKVGSEVTVFRTGESLESIANMRDGETIALTGFSPRLFSLQEKTPQTLSPDIVVFVTTRIVRRAGDDVQPIALKR